jgi:hypothetical protein
MERSHVRRIRLAFFGIYAHPDWITTILQGFWGIFFHEFYVAEGLQR